MTDAAARDFAALMGAPLPPDSGKTPAEDFAALFEPTEPPPAVETPPRPPVPAPNTAQGTSDTGPRPPTATEFFLQAMDDAIANRNPHAFPPNATAAEAGQHAGWHDLRSQA